MRLATYAMSAVIVSILTPGKSCYARRCDSSIYSIGCKSNVCRLIYSNDKQAA